MELKNAQGIIEEIKRGEIKTTEVVNECLEKIKELDPKINAFVTLNEKALEQAKEVQKTSEEKPLKGLPIAVKDNEETKEMKTTYGSKFYKNHEPKQNSTLVDRLREAGAIIIGKTNLPEFGLIAYTDNLITGATRNPWNLDKTVGGSSGGSAAAVASDMVPVATGTDGGGSIRIPASFCNLYGLKPSFGRIPAYPSRPIFSGLHSKGFITRCVEDTALLLDVAAGRDSRDMHSLPKNKASYLNSIRDIEEGRNSFDNVNIAFSPDLGYAVVEPEVEEIVRNAAYELEEFGQVEEVEIRAPNLENELTKKMCSELVSMLGEDLEDWKKVAFPPFVGFASIAESVTTNEYIKIERRKKDLWASLRPVFEEYDFLITPTVSVPPFEIGEMSVDEIAGEDASPLDWMPFTYPFNFTSQPAASIPAGFTNKDLPVGMQIVGRHFDDLGVLKISKIYQDLKPWQDKAPDLSTGNNKT